ncbi:subtilisin-like serine protease [Thoreauomyces humboldtii]|nr:subtilisin-like serine protease [Thoreauomyces humboldtii]
MVHLLSIALLALTSMASASPLRRAPAGTAIEHSYIVTFKTAPSFAPRNVEADANALLFPEQAASSLSASSTKLLHSYDFGSNAFQGFAARITDPAALARIKASSNVAAIEEDATVTLNAVEKSLPAGLWGLDFLDGNKDSSYTYNAAAGAGVDAYVIDTGCQTSHPEFEGRATWGASFTDETTTTDGNGHGTHVSGTIGSKTYGVAKKVSIICVRVLDASGSGTNSGVIAGINWAAKSAKASGRKSVANMSLGGSKSTAVDAAAKGLISAKVALAVAAGNDSDDACTGSPAGASGVYTVAASDKTNDFAYFSAYGSCVEIIAPGVDILSTWKGSSTNTISGTSMATPHVVGALALAYSTNAFASPAAAFKYLTAKSKKNTITSVPESTPNYFLQI